MVIENVNINGSWVKEWNNRSWLQKFNNIFVIFFFVVKSKIVKRENNETKIVSE